VQRSSISCVFFSKIHYCFLVIHHSVSGIEKKLSRAHYTLTPQDDQTNWNNWNNRQPSQFPSPPSKNISTDSRNQGSSVASAFLKDPSWKIRGTSRDPSKPSSQALVAKGIEIVAGDVASLKAAVQGADVVFATTAFNDAFVHASPSDLENLSPGQTLREWCYELEVQQGKNIADAVATVEELEVFTWSGLSDAGRAAF
jgi:hypothetical protein